LALANTRNGVVQAWEVAQALQVTPQEADAILTRLAKENPDHVSVDIDDHGNVLYRFPSQHWGGLAQMAPNAPPPVQNGAHVRVHAPSRVASEVRVDARDPLDDDVALEDAARQKAR
jgi:hypothetical protein